MATVSHGIDVFVEQPEPSKCGLKARGRAQIGRLNLWDDWSTYRFAKCAFRLDEIAVFVDPRPPWPNEGLYFGRFASTK